MKAVRTAGERIGTVAVVLNYQDTDDTIDAVSSLQASTTTDLAVVVVDNNEDPTPAATIVDAVDPCVSVLRSGANVGYAAGNNLGVRFALDRYAPSYVWIVNPDATVAPDALERMLGTAERNPDAGLIGSRLLGTDQHGNDIVLYDGAEVDPWTSATRHVGAGQRVARRRARAPHDTGYANGASMLVTRDLLRVVGRIPEHYFLYFEETDYAFRARSRGFRVVVDPHAVVWHKRRSWASLPTSSYIYYMVRNRDLFCRAWRFDLTRARDEVTGPFLAHWRQKVGEGAPELVDSFDSLVRQAQEDGAAGRSGPSDAPRRWRLA